VILAPLLFLSMPAALAEVHLTTAEALALAFQGCQIVERTAYLSTEQRKAASALADVPVESGLIRQHLGLCGGAVAGTAYFDTHMVRDLPATLMVVVDPSGEVARVEVLSFRGPDENRPPQEFYGYLAGHGLDEELTVKKTGGRLLTGATLSIHATIQAVRRTLALHRIIEAGPQP